MYDDHFTAWEFENRQKMKNEKRVKGNDYCVFPNAINWANGILQGKWYRPTIRHLKKIGVDIDTSKRPILSVVKTIKYKVKMRIYHSLSVKGIYRIRKLLSCFGFNFITKN